MSFALAFARRSLASTSTLVASVFDSAEQARARYGPVGIEDTIAALAEQGAEVLFEVDATSLPSCPALKGRCFDLVQFQFPHVLAKGHIEMDRKLLADFFKSAMGVLRQVSSGGASEEKQVPSSVLADAL